MKDRIKGYTKKLFAILKKPEMAILPSNIAFHIILAIIPLLTIIALVASYFNLSIDLLTSFVSKIMPGQVSNVINEIISGKGFDQSVGIFNFLAFLIASNGTYAVINTADMLYKIRKTDHLKARISSIILLLIVIILFVFMLIVPIFGDNILDLMTSASLLSKYSEKIIALFNLVKWPVTFLIVYLNTKLLYTVAPTKNIKSEETTMGALFATVGWIILTIIFKYYINHFARYDIIYGNLASIIILMVWVYFLSYIFVLGMAINVSRREEQELINRQLEIESLNEEKKKLKEEKKKAKKKVKKIKEDVTE